MTRFGILALILVTAAACDKPTTDKGSAASASASASAGGTAAVSAPSQAVSAATPPKPAGPAGTWTGKYKSEPGGLTYAENWKTNDGPKWAGEDSGAGLGEGEISLTIEQETLKVSGSASGAIGDAVLTGVVLEGLLRAKVERKDASDRGLTGTAAGTVGADKIDGEMNLSLGSANVIRKATFSLARKP